MINKLFTALTLVGALMMTDNVWATINDGLVLYLPLNGNTEDASGLANHGSAVGAVSTTDRAGNADSAYYFNGSAYIIVPHNDSLNLNQHTITAWINTNGASDAQNIIGKVTPLVHESLNFSLSNANKLRTNFATGEAVNNFAYGAVGGIMSTTLQTKHWYFVAMTYDGTRVSLYLNGQVDVKYPKTGDTRTNNNALAVGRHGGDADQQGDDKFFNGVIDEVRIYNRALSAEEITTLWNGSENACLAHYDANTAQLIVPCLQVPDPILGSQIWQASFNHLLPDLTFELDLTSAQLR